MIARCKPLDVNSTYAYLLLCQHFSETCVIARLRGTIVGFVSAYVPPRQPDTIFVWQVAVHPDARGRALGRCMLESLLGTRQLDGVDFLETTVSPSNEASRRMFQSLACDIGASVEEQMLFDERAFGNEKHESEVLLKLGPLNRVAHFSRGE